MKEVIAPASTATEVKVVARTVFVRKKMPRRRNEQDEAHLKLNEVHRKVSVEPERNEKPRDEPKIAVKAHLDRVSRMKDHRRIGQEEKVVGTRQTGAEAGPEAVSRDAGPEAVSKGARPIEATGAVEV
jgi:hypothetical protein